MTKKSSFPIGHVLGYLLSLLLTFAAAFVALKMDSLTSSVILLTIGALAVIQAALQLFMFMHVTEGDKHAQLINILYGVFMAAVIVAGTIWVMSSGMHFH